MLLKLLAISLVMMSSESNAFNILIVAPMPYRSHWIFMEKIIDRLLERGNEITVISPFKFRFDGYMDNDLKEIIIAKYPVEKIFPSKDIFNGKYESDISYIQAQYKIGRAVSEHTLNQPEVKKLMLKNDNKFDAVLVDSNHQDALYMFAYKYNCPLITIDVNGNSNYLDEAMGVMTPHSFIPHPVSKYENNMSYFQRCYNALLHLYESAVRRFSHIPAQNKLAQKHFRNLISGQMPHLENVIKNISVVLSNTYRMTEKRPKMASQVDIAGAHIEQIYMLPANLKVINNENGLEILSNTQNAIYFSFGSYLKPSEMPQEKIDEIIKAFSKIKRKVLWQFDGDVPAGLPDNVIMQKWFPQNDLLGNKKIALFITHGGTLSFQEALSNRIPMIIIPFTGNQYRNALLAERENFGKMLLFDDLNEKTLSEKIIEITEEPSYFVNIGKAKSKLLDAPQDLSKEAAFWVEYVCRHKGIEKSPSVNFSWFTYYSYDVIAFYIGTLAIIILFWIYTIYLIVRRHRNREQKGKFKYY